MKRMLIFLALFVGLLVIAPDFAPVLADPPPPQVNCPLPDYRNGSGHFRSRAFHAWAFWGEYISDIQVDYGASSPGITNVVAVDITGIGTEHVEGYIEYDVLDHCQPSGSVNITAITPWEFVWCYFSIVLTNDPPVADLPDTLLAYHDQSLSWPILAQDPDGDPVAGIVLDDYWFVEDSLHTPANTPSCTGDNPAILTWTPDMSDMGIWIFSFISADECGAADTTEVTLRVWFPFCGDLTADGLINLGDLIYLVSYLYKSGPAPEPLCRGDANCDGVVNVSDVVRLINYLYRSDLPPCFDCYPYAK
jgi:hypothetical protein